MSQWFIKPLNFFRWLFSSGVAMAVLNGIRAAAPYVEAAIEFVTLGAQITGGPAGRTAATVLKFAKELGVGALFSPGATDEQLRTAMRDAVVNALRLKFPDASTAQLNRAVEIAFGAIKP